jgi:hypoxanthine phosphoribosyltransferase
LHKPANIKSNIRLDYVGFTIPPEFVIGYGLDYAQRDRNLKAIWRQVPVRKRVRTTE